MSDKIKKFLQQHRNAVDAAAPDAHHWKGVEKTLDRLVHADSLERTLLLDRVLLDTEMPSASVWAAIERELDTPAAPKTLEHWIQQNREAMDSEVPDLRVWAGIEQSVAGQSSSKAKAIPMNWQRSLLRIAASITLLITGVGMGLWYAHHGEKAEAGMAMSDVSKEYAELEQYYQRDIAGKQVKLASFQGNQSTEVHQDLDEMDRMMEDLRKELADVPEAKREQVVRAMIDNYKAKAAILQRVLERLESSKTETNNSRKKHEIKNI
ncbi:MAG: hypothetical protein WCR52_24375 [Bacteroidota bacterium]